MLGLVFWLVRLFSFFALRFNSVLLLRAGGSQANSNKRARVQEQWLGFKTFCFWEALWARRVFLYDSNSVLLVVFMRVANLLWVWLSARLFCDGLV